jgi:hypothetical protein
MNVIGVQALWIGEVILLTIVGFLTQTPTNFWDVIQTSSLMTILIILADMSERQLRNGKV